MSDSPQISYDLIEAHKHSIRNRGELDQSEACGCFYCLSIFSPSEIDIWWDDDVTATCPRCGIDSVIGSASGFAVDKEFLKAMHDKWFNV